VSRGRARTARKQLRYGRKEREEGNARSPATEQNLKRRAKLLCRARGLPGEASQALVPMTRNCPRGRNHGPQFHVAALKETDCVAVDAVRLEPVSAIEFPENWENTGNLHVLIVENDFKRLIGEQIQRLAAKFPTQRNWEFLWRNRETKG